jgi:hypothetical protein
MNIANDPNVRENPSLNSYVLTNFPATPGTIFLIQMNVENIAGLIAQSTPAALILAGIPSAPSDIPIND